MKQFYRQVFLDETTWKFYAVCAGCGERRDACRLPRPCRDKALLDELSAGKVGGMKQMLYNLNYSAAVRYLTRFFNRCPVCGQWVCDECFDLEDDYGACAECAKQLSPTDYTEERNVNLNGNT